MDSSSKIRIIGGKWRGRKLNVIDVPGLRPSQDRTRETLFNWLQGKIVGARCLDLFSGTGALAFEALSRGASEVIMVESNPKIVETLKQTAEIFGSKAHQIVRDDAISWIRNSPRVFDIIFLDPPFGHGYTEKCCQMIIEQSLLADNGIVYIESEKDIHIPPMLKINKMTQIGQAQSILAELNREN